MILNSNRTSRQRNFDCGKFIMRVHEVGPNADQLIFEINGQTNNNYVNPGRLLWLQWEGSAELLVPEEMLISAFVSYFSALPDHCDCKGFISSTADYFNVEENLICDRIIYLKQQLRESLSATVLAQLPKDCDAAGVQGKIHSFMSKFLKQVALYRSSEFS